MNLRQSVSRLVRSGSSSAKDAVSLVRGGSSARSVDNRREALEQHAARARKEPAEHFTDNRNFIRETRAVLDILIGLTPAAKQQRHFFVWLWRLAAPAMLLLAALMLLMWMTAPRCRIEELHGAAGTLPPSTRYGRMSALCSVPCAPFRHGGALKAPALTTLQACPLKFIEVRSLLRPPSPTFTNVLTSHARACRRADLRCGVRAGTRQQRLEQRAPAAVGAKCGLVGGVRCAVRGCSEPAVCSVRVRVAGNDLRYEATGGSG